MIISVSFGLKYIFGSIVYITFQIITFTEIVYLKFGCDCNCSGNFVALIISIKTCSEKFVLRHPKFNKTNEKKCII
jgi:hypothetical protein